MQLVAQADQLDAGTEDGVRSIGVDGGALVVAVGAVVIAVLGGGVLTVGLGSALTGGGVEVLLGLHALDDIQQGADVLILLGDDAHGLVHVVRVAVGVPAVPAVLDHLHGVIAVVLLTAHGSGGRRGDSRTGVGGGGGPGGRHRVVTVCAGGPGRLAVLVRLDGGGQVLGGHGGSVVSVGVCHVLLSSFEFPDKTVDVQPGLFTGPGLIDERQMVDADIPLDGVVGLSLPDAGGPVKVQSVAQGQLPEPALFHDVGIVDDDFGPDVLAVLIAFGEYGPDVFLVHIPLIHHSGLMGEDDRLPLVAGKTGRVKDFLGKPELPAGGAVGVLVFKDTGRGDHGMVNQVAFLGPVGFVQRDAVQPQHPLQLGLIQNLRPLPPQRPGPRSERW